MASTRSDGGPSRDDPTGSLPLGGFFVGLVVGCMTVLMIAEHLDWWGSRRAVMADRCATECEKAAEACGRARDAVKGTK